MTNLTYNSNITYTAVPEYVCSGLFKAAQAADPAAELLDERDTSLPEGVALFAMFNGNKVYSNISFLKGHFVPEEVQQLVDELAQPAPSLI